MVLKCSHFLSPASCIHVDFSSLTFYLMFSLFCTLVADLHTGLIPNISLSPSMHARVVLLSPLFHLFRFFHTKGLTLTLVPCFPCKVVITALNQQRGEAPSGLANTYKIPAKQSSDLHDNDLVLLRSVQLWGLVQRLVQLSAWE